MSLLNEALRKNKYENPRKGMLNFPSQENHGRTRSIIFITALAAAAGVCFLFWPKQDDNSFEHPTAYHGTEVMEKALPVEQVPEGMAVPDAVIQKKDETEKKDREDIQGDEVLYPEEPRKTVPVNVKKPGETAIVKEENESRLQIFNRETVNSEKGYYSKALQLHRQGRIEKAVAMYKKALSLNPSNNDALFNIASLYITMARYADAYNILIKLLDVNPSDPKTILNLAVTEIGLGKNRDALSHLRDINDEDDNVRFGISFHKGVALSRIGERDRAMACYKNAEKLNGDYPALLLNMALLYEKSGNYSEAINYYSRLIETDSSAPKEKDRYRQRIETLKTSFSYPFKTSL